MKNTKRSMIITTVLMVVVLVVAISTSTFAWYTASNTGSATSAALKSAESSAANIAVGWNRDATGSSIAFSSTVQSLFPMCPKEVPTAGASSIVFNSANIDLEGNFNTPSDKTAWTINNPALGTETTDDDSDDVGADTLHSFFVINHNINTGATVTMTAEFTGDNAEKLLVAVFVDNELKAIITEVSQYVVGTIGTGNVTNANDLTKTSALKVAPSTGFEFSLAAKADAGTAHTAEIKIMAWLDGTLLTSANAGKTTTFSFGFTAA